MNGSAPIILRQHLIDPVICIRCNTCEETCPVDAVTHDSRNYVVKPDVCNGCGACISPCPTGAIDHWHKVLKSEAYPVEEQLTWDELPSQRDVEGVVEDMAVWQDVGLTPQASDTVRGATVPPRTASTPSVNLHTIRNPGIVTVIGNYRITAADRSTDTHHIVLGFGSSPLPLLEGQSIGIIPPGANATGKPHHARQYSIASPRDGERPQYNDVALTVKRVTVDHKGQATVGVCSNYLCDLKKGDSVKVIGPFGTTFLMPEDPDANLLMVCTGTGSAPMRAMTERRRRLRQQGDRGKLILFFGARTPQELPYFGPLAQLPKDLIDTNLAFSRVPEKPRRYVQDLMLERIADLSELIADERTHIYVCGLRGMEDGVLQVLRHAAETGGVSWQDVWGRLKAEGRLHLETY